MPIYVYLILGGLLLMVLVTYGVRAHRAKREAHKQELMRLGFFPCPDRKKWLEETVNALERNQGYRYEVRDPTRLTGDHEVYYYLKARHSDQPRDAILIEEEILFPLKRARTEGLLLFVKPSALGHGLATRIIRSLATAPRDTQPDDLEKIDLPADLQNSNLLGALGPAGARLYDLVDAGTLSVVQRLGDVGATTVLFRDGWCAIASGGTEARFRLGELLSQVRPLLH